MLYQDGDDDSDHGDRDLPSGSRPDLPRIFKVVALISDYFPAATPVTPSATDSSPWFDDFGNPRLREPRAFLSLFEKLAPLRQEVAMRFAKAADDKKATTALPKWGDVYCLGDLKDYHPAPKVRVFCAFSIARSRPPDIWQCLLLRVLIWRLVSGAS